MKIQSSHVTTMGYVNTLNNEKIKEQNLAYLLLDEDDKNNQKPRFEVRNEDGFIRKYVVKANGDKILISETKETESKEGKQSNETGDLIDIAYDMLMKQLELIANPELKEKQTLPAWEKENGIARYKTGI